MIKNFMNYPLGINSFDLQLFAEGDDGAGTGGTSQNNSPKFSGQYKEMADPVSGQKVMIPVELETFFGHTISKTRESIKTEVEGKYKPLLETLEKEAGEGSLAKAELEKIRLEAMSAEERAQANAKKKIEEYEKKYKDKESEATTWKGRFEKSTIRNDIMSSFGDAKLCNSGQVAMLFEMEGNAVISEIVDNEGKPTGQFETRVSLILEDKDGKPERVEGTVQELFKRWISLDRNSHHLLNTMPAGSGARGGGGYRSGMSADALAKLSPVERLKEGRREQGRH
jgi:hypothetical protein